MSDITLGIIGSGQLGSLLCQAAKKLKGLDSLLSMAQMPKGVAVGCLAIDGAFNAGILAASIIGNFDEKIKTNLEKWRRTQSQSIKKKPK